MLRRVARLARRTLRIWRRGVEVEAWRWPPGHFYSPIPDLDEVRRDEGWIYAPRDHVPGIDLALDHQLAVLTALAPAAETFPFGDEPSAERRFYDRNGWFQDGDARVLYALCITDPPARLIEVGSGFSSALLLDTLDEETSLTFIDPNPQDRLDDLLRPGDEQRTTVHACRAQDFDPSWFVDQLNAGDILFIDSSHVAKVGSDVNLLLLEVLPRLKSGVRVHIHDVQFPFEYPKQWVDDGYAWNETYLVRALLTHTTRFRIDVFNGYLARIDQARQTPFYKRGPGSSLWLSVV